MKESPIIFNSEMVRAILDGRKTQDRRICKKQPIAVDVIPRHMPNEWGFYGGYFPHHGVVVESPYGKIKDHLWIRENFYLRKDRIGVIQDAGNIRYETDKIMSNPEYLYQYKKFPSIHMPRWASRITLEIVHVRVERLNDISEEDAKSEGADKEYLPDLGRSFALHVRGFHSLWESIYGKGSWEVNPWVWVLEFKRI